MHAIANWEPSAGGRIRAICQWCDRRSRAVAPADDGRPDLWELRGWSESPYPVAFAHRDGSCGSLFTCPGCAQLRAGRQRAGIRPLLTPAPARVAARQASGAMPAAVLVGAAR